MENHLIPSGIYNYHPKHQKYNIENQAIGKMKKVNRNPNPSPENINYFSCFYHYYLFILSDMFCGVKNDQCYVIIILVHGNSEEASHFMD